MCFVSKAPFANLALEGPVVGVDSQVLEDVARLPELLQAVQVGTVLNFALLLFWQPLNIKHVAPPVAEMSCERLVLI